MKWYISWRLNNWVQFKQKAKIMISFFFFVVVLFLKCLFEDTILFKILNLEWFIDEIVLKFNENIKKIGSLFVLDHFKWKLFRLSVYHNLSLFQYNFTQFKNYNQLHSNILTSIIVVKRISNPFVELVHSCFTYQFLLQK